MNGANQGPAADLATIRQRSAARPDFSVWVSASAGTGKTKVLTDRVLSLLLEGTPPERLLCLTFTRAAAAEMAGRIAEQLGQWTMAPEEDLEKALTSLTGGRPDEDTCRRARRLFAAVLDTPGGMRIETIHAFCQSLLRRFPIEAQIAPHFSLMDERDAEETLALAEAHILREAQQARDPELTDVLAEITKHVYEFEFPDLISALADRRGRLRRMLDRAGGPASLSDMVRDALGLAPGDTMASLTEQAVGDAAFDQLGLRMAAEALRQGSESEAGNGEMLAGWLDADRTGRIAGLTPYLDYFLTREHREGEVRPRKRLINKPTAAAAPGAEDILEAEAQRLSRFVLKRRAAATASATRALTVISQTLIDTYQREKRSRALLDYEDLILDAGRLFARPGISSWVLYKLDGGLDHVLIDEAQDTSPDQWSVVDSIVDEFFVGEGARDLNRTMFAVGDVKQSIFSFQGAEPQNFASARDRLAGTIPGAGGQWSDVDLNISFRSVAPVLRAVDAVFEQVSARDGVALDDRPIVHEAAREGNGGLVELWPPVPPLESDETEVWKPPVEGIRGGTPEARLAAIVATRISRMINGGEVLESAGRPIAAGDIMVLVRRRGAFVDDLVRALKSLDIDVAGVDRLVLTEHIAVMDLLALGRFLLFPEDDLTLATVFKSPIVGLTEEELFELAYGREGSLWSELQSRRESSPRFAAAHEFLRHLLAAADYLPPYELFADILGARGGRRRLLARLGPEAIDPLAEFLNLALAFERSHTSSLQGFLRWMEAGAVEVKRDLDQGRGGAVRVMTIHGAKGLQAPIVFLPDTMQVPRQEGGLLWGGRDEDGAEFLLWPPRRAFRETVGDRLAEEARVAQQREYRRLLYVAMTRAEDRLYICGWETKNKAPEGNWYELIGQAFEPLAEEVDDPILAEWDSEPAKKIFRLAAPQTKEVEKIPEPQELDPIPLPSWTDEPPAPEPPLPRPLSPSRPADDDPPVRSPLGQDGSERFRRGLLIHNLLQTLPDLPRESWPGAAAAYLSGAAQDLGQADRERIARETLAVMDDPAAAPLFGEGSRAEVPIVGLVGDRAVSGQIDRILVGEEKVTIVDYKTNRPPPRSPEDVSPAYLRQLAIYRSVVADIYADREIACVLLWTDGPIVMEIPGELTDRYVP